MESNNLLPEFTVEPSILNFEIMKKPSVVLTIEEEYLMEARTNSIKVSSVCLPKRIKEPNNLDINDWFNSLPIPHDYPMDIILPSYVLELSNNTIF